MPGCRSLRTKGLVIGGSTPLPYEGCWPDEIPIKNGEYHNFITKLTSQHNCCHFRCSADTMLMLPHCHILRSTDDLGEENDFCEQDKELREYAQYERSIGCRRMRLRDYPALIHRLYFLKLHHKSTVGRNVIGLS